MLLFFESIIVEMEDKGSVLMHRYELGRMLGQGTFAKVHYARNLVSGMSVAIKIIDKEKVFKVGLIDQIKREISVMRLVRHPNVVELYEVMASKAKIYFVMEYAKGGELFDKVAKGKLEEAIARKYFQQLISAVDYCHSRGVCHRDLKPENLLLDEHGNLKVSDFGLSALADSKRQDGLLHTTCGTPAYVAPEVIKGNGYDGSKADIWSCGVILYVFLAGYLPFHDSNIIELYRKIEKGEVKYPKWFGTDVHVLLSKILDPNPKTRISIAEIMENSWFKKGLEDYEPQVNSVEGKETTHDDIEELFEANERMECSSELNQVAKPCNLNAFDLISFSFGFDLSGLFDGIDRTKKTRFTSNKPANTIVSRLEEVAKRLRMKVKKKEAGVLKIQGSKEGRKGTLEIDVEIFEITGMFHMVEMKKTSGDTLEFDRTVKQDMRPALKDIVWTWQGERSTANSSVRSQT